jgi:hypothetical protein
MASNNDDPALIVWRALNVLALVPLVSASNKERMLEAERLLVSVMLELWESADQPDSRAHIGYASHTHH